MKVRIVTPWAALAVPLAAELEKSGSWQVEVEIRDKVDAPELVHTSAVGYEAIQSLFLLLGGMADKVSISRVEDVHGADAELRLGEADIGQTSLKVVADSPRLLSRLDSLFHDGVGFSRADNEIRLVEGNRVSCKEVSPFLRGLVNWFLRREGIVASNSGVRRIGRDKVIEVFVSDPEEAARPLPERITVLVGSDDSEVAARFDAELANAGYPNRIIQCIEVESGESLADDLKISVIKLGLREGGGSLEIGRLQALVGDFARREGIDVSRYAVEVSDGEGGDSPLEAGLPVAVVLPFQSIRKGLLKPYSGDTAERFKVVVHSDGEGEVDSVCRSLLDMDVAECSAGALGAEDRLEGFRIRWKNPTDYPETASKIRTLVLTTMASLGAGKGFTLREDEGDEDNEIRIYLPIRGVRDGELLTAMASPGRYPITLLSESERPWDSLVERLREAGYRVSFGDRRLSGSDDPPGITFGGAAAAFIDGLKERLEGLTGKPFALGKAWGDHDTDIWVRLPASDADSSSASMPVLPGAGGNERSDLSGWLAPDREDATGAIRPFIELSGTRIRIGEVELPRRGGPRHPFAPPASSFSHYCIDRHTAGTLHHIARAVALREPCLLEGETSTSKTSSILFLASLLDQPVIRLNLNGQTDTGELIGRYVPQRTLGQLPFRPEELCVVEDLLEPETRIILSRASEESRTLTAVEVQQVMANENMRSHPWCWQDGLVVQAMREGWWLLLDEVNLAEPQILERLNSVLEREPFLVLTEHDNSVYGPGGHPVHPDFRIFATMNPAEYSGRTVLSPAYRDRWRGYRYVPGPGEDEYGKMLRFLVFGEQPDLAVLGVPYSGSPGNPSFGVLADVEGIAGTLAALARFHAAVEHASGKGDGPARMGGRRKERLVFTRRGLLSVMEYAAVAVASEESPARAIRSALHRYYIDRVATEEDRSLMVQILDATGLGPGN